MDEDEAAYEADLASQEPRKPAPQPRRPAMRVVEPEQSSVRPARGGVMVRALKNTHINGEHVVTNQITKLKTGETVEMRPGAERFFVENGFVTLA